MSKFKAGDKVVKKYPSIHGSWDTHEYVTVDYVVDDRVYAKETGTWVAEDRVKFYEPSTRAKREELEAALNIVYAYNIGIVGSGGMYIRNEGSEIYRSQQEFLDVLIPLESPAQKKLKELEDQQRELANQMEKLRSEL